MSDLSNYNETTRSSRGHIMHIRAYLFLMAAGILIPVIVFSGLALNMLQDAEKAAAQRGIHETARSVALLVDRELYSAEAALKVLAASPALGDGDMAAFYRQAKMASRGPTGWTFAQDGDGKMLMNTYLPFGSPLPKAFYPSLVRHVMSTGKTEVSNLLDGAASRRLITTVNVAVPLAGGQRYVLSTALSTDHFNELLAGVNVPPGWLVAIIDDNGRFIARNLNPAEMVGKPARPELVAAARRAYAGQLRHSTLENVESIDVFTHSSLSGWMVAVAAPVELIERSARHASLLAALGLLAAVVCAGGLAALFGRQHVRSIARAVDAASALGDGVPPPPCHSRVVEVNELHAALHAAGRQLVHAQAYRKNAELERQLLLEREQKARVMAEQQNSAKDQFLAMLGHELRNPLAPISTAAQLLKLPAIDERRVRYASDVIARQVDHMNRLLGDMLDVSRVTRGLVSLRPETIDLKAVLDRAVEQTRALFDSRQHRLTIELPPGPVTLQGDSTRLIQVFANLLGNAAKYTEPHGQITLAMQAGDQVVVTVTDNGEGIAPALLPRLFDLFSQGERTPDRSQGGLGLGLALVKSLVQLHGGEVDAISAGAGHGSSFRVTLPRGETAQMAPAGPRTAVQAPRTPLRVMIVDDNVDGAITLSLYLQAAGGHHVCTYYDAAAALEWAAFEKPDAFILDIGLPDMTGYELARRLRAMPQFEQAPLIALTGYGQPQDKEEARQAGFDGHVAKPAEPADILALLARSVEQKAGAAFPE
ncbi:MAG: hybrid sensor histidine kinase/response regulator [Massilia sp.]|nr:hybrid sensor histidine kinase/response regulator [Massilia sp.]